MNHQPVTERAIGDGDILHLGDFEFRIRRREAADLQREDSSETATHPTLPRSPVELLKVAEGIGAAAELSRLLRRRAIELVRDQATVGGLFLNTHPSELEDPVPVESMEQLRGLAPHLDLILEIHESALGHPAVMASLRDRLSEINLGLAYDDFGSGQASLLELAEAPPHYLKFDRRFIAGIDKGPPSRRRLLASLVAASRELRVKTVAEGVETAAEAEACIRLGLHARPGLLLRPPGSRRHPLGHDPGPHAPSN